MTRSRDVVRPVASRSSPDRGVLKDAADGPDPSLKEGIRAARFENEGRSPESFPGLLLDGGEDQGV